MFIIKKIRQFSTFKISTSIIDDSSSSSMSVLSFITTSLFSVNDGGTSDFAVETDVVVANDVVVVEEEDVVDLF